MKPTSNQFNVLLTPALFAQLQALADAAQLTKADIIRQLIYRTHDHTILGIPTCPSGQACYCPHMHPPKPASNLETIQ